MPFPAVTICNLNPMDESNADARNYMISVAVKKYPVLQNCTLDKLKYVNAYSSRIYQKYSTTNLTYPEFCNLTSATESYPYNISQEFLVKASTNGIVLNETVWCRMPQNALLSLIVYEFNGLLNSSNWTNIGGRAGMGLIVNVALDTMGWPNTGWIRYMARTAWKFTTVSSWFEIYGWDVSLLINSAKNLDDCLKYRTFDYIQNLLQIIKMDAANRNMISNSNLYISYGFSAENMIQNGLFNNLNITWQNVTTFVNNEYGQCFTFNNQNGALMGPISNTSESGPDYGLKMTLSVGL